MNEIITELMRLCPGRIDIQLDYHKLFGETAAQVIGRSRIATRAIEKEMINRDTIIRVQANSKFEAVCYHYDFEAALSNVLKQVKKWEKGSNR